VQRFIPPSIQSIMDPAVEYGFKHIFSLKENKPRPPSAPAQRSERLSSQNLGHTLVSRKKRLSTRARPATAGSTRRKHSPRSGMGRDNSRYNFFKLNIIGQQRSRPKGDRTQYPTVILHEEEKRQTIMRRRRPQTARIRTPEVHMTVQTNTVAPSSNLRRPVSARLEPHRSTTSKIYKGIPGKALKSELMGEGITETMLEEDSEERKRPTSAELERLLSQWLADAELGTTAFHSFAVFCEYKMRRGLASTDRWAGANPLRACITGICLDKAATEMPMYKGLLNVFADEFYRSTYIDWDDTLKSKLERNGSSTDAESVFRAKTFSEEYHRLNSENQMLILRVNDFLAVQKNILDEMKQRGMTSGVGIVCRNISNSLETNQISFRYSRAMKKQVADAKNVVQAQTDDERTAQLDNPSNDHMEHLAVLLDKLNEQELQELVCDLGVNHANAVTSSVIGTLFRAMNAGERLSFIVSLSSATTEHEKMAWLETLPAGKRDGGLRYILKKILNGEPYENLTQQLCGDEKQQEADKNLLKRIAEIRKSSAKSDYKAHERFIQILMAMLYEGDTDNEDEHKQGLHSPDDVCNKVEKTERLHEKIEQKLSDLIRQSDATHDDCSFLRNKVEMLEHKLKEAHQINLNASVMKNEIGIIDEKTQKDLETLENTNIDIEKEKGQNDSPLVKHTTSLFKKEKPRRHSFYGILQGEHREEAIARHRRANSPFQKISNDDGLSAAVLPARADHPPATKLKPFSLSELNFVILDIYQSKIVADSIADADMARRVHLSEHVRSYYVKMHGTRSFASHHCSHLQRELPLYASTNFRCRLFALLIGTLEPRSYLNHVAATDFFLGVLLKIFDINEKELMIQNVMPLSLKEMMGDGLNYDGHRPCVLDAKKACSIIRELFSFEEVSEKNLFFLASFVNKIMRFSIMCVCCLLSHASNSIRMVPTLAFGFRYGLRVYLSCSCVTKQCLTISIVCFIGVWGGDGTLGINFKRGEWGPSGSFSV
jgi:hypothetical protein